MEKKKGSFTLPGEAGYEELTLKLAERWGADVIRDSDGTELSEEITVTSPALNGRFVSSKTMVPQSERQSPISRQLWI